MIQKRTPPKRGQNHFATQTLLAI
jgi:hypothetical protein